MEDDAANRVAALKTRRDAWMAQRSAAMERQNIRNEEGELVALAGAGDGAVNDDRVLDKITERITHRLREEIRIQARPPAVALLASGTPHIVRVRSSRIYPTSTRNV